MKKFAGFALFYTRVISIRDAVLHPFSGMPVPEFNYQYDETML